MNVIHWLTSWYKENCNGDWEHSYGIKIETVDNPGWYVCVDLAETDVAGKQLLQKKVVISDEDWFEISSNGVYFKGYGDANKLEQLIKEFQQFTMSNNRDDS